MSYGSNHLPETRMSLEVEPRADRAVATAEPDLILPGPSSSFRTTLRTEPRADQWLITLPEATPRNRGFDGP